MTVDLTFLGTSDPIPSASRNPSSLLLSYNGENILIDCGEGTQRQFRKAKLNPCKTTRILITHWHGDHVLGLPGLLSTLSLSGYNKDMYIYGPLGTKKFINEMLRAFAFQKNYKIIVEEVSGKFFFGKDFYLEAKAMDHGIPANAYSFVKPGQIRIDREKLKKTGIASGPILSKLKEGKDITYEGKKYKARDLTYRDEDVKVSVVMDTLMNDKIASFVKGANLFVCESTYSKGDSEKAKEHMHMTSEQVGKVAKKAKVGKVYLTHVSSRYQNNPKLILNEARKVFAESYLAKDLDVVSV